jgi:antitoxin component of MazEF toxin-antitoxin module
MLKWSNSLAVRIPKTVTAGKIPTLAALVSQITPRNRYEEVSTGPEVGKESTTPSSCSPSASVPTHTRS